MRWGPCWGIDLLVSWADRVGAADNVGQGFPAHAGNSRDGRQGHPAAVIDMGKQTEDFG
jgi:hypothetical protein